MGYNKPVGRRGNKQERKRGGIVGVIVVIVARQRGYRSKPGPWFRIERKEWKVRLKARQTQTEEWQPFDGKQPQVLPPREGISITLFFPLRLLIPSHWPALTLGTAIDKYKIHRELEQCHTWNGYSCW